MKFQKKKILRKTAAAALGLTVLFGVSAAVLPDVIDSVSITANAAATVNASNVTLYGMNDWAEEFISIPSTFNKTFQLKVTGATNVSYSSSNSSIVKVSSTGLIEPNVTTWYWYGSKGYSSPVSGKDPDKITKSMKYGSATVRVTADGVVHNVEVTVADYADYYANQVMDKYIADEGLKSKSTEVKLDKIAKFVADRNYDYRYQSYQALIIAGGGDCWASTNTVNAMAKKVGLDAWTRNGNRDSGAGSGHRNSMVTDGTKYYEVEAGYYETAPRSYSVKERKSLFSTRYNYTYGGIEIYQYDGKETPAVMNVPTQIEGKAVVALGNSAFYGESTIEKINIPEGVKYIGDLAMFNCTNLTTLNIPSTVVSTGSRIISSCTKLNDVKIASGSSLSYVDGAIYCGTKLVCCPNNTNVTIVDGTTEIESFAFMNNSNLKLVNIPKTVKKISDGAFIRCSSLSTVNFKGEGLETIGKQAFGTTKFKYIEIPSTVNEFGEDVFIQNTSAVIIGTPGSKAESYASDNSMTFMSVNDKIKNTSALSATEFKAGQKITVNGASTGGRGTHKYSVMYKKHSDSEWKEVQKYSENGTVTIKLGKAVKYDICVKVIDDLGMVDKKYFTVKPMLVNTSKLSATSVKKGSPITVTASAEGGTGGYKYAVFYKKHSDTAWAKVQDYSKNTTVKITPKKAVSYDVCVKVQDSSGKIVKKYYQFSVT